MEQRFFGLADVHIDKLSRLKWIVEEFLTTDLQALPYMQRQAFIQNFFRYLYGKDLIELTAKEAAKYRKYLKQWEGK